MVTTMQLSGEVIKSAERVLYYRLISCDPLDTQVITISIFMLSHSGSDYHNKGVPIQCRSLKDG